VVLHNGNKEKVITVVIPVYNRPELVKRAINSVKEQSLKADEIIVIDDGSTDKTAEVLKSFKTIKVITQKNSGVSSARNRGIKEATYAWIAFLDSDDVWHKDKLKLQAKFHKQNPDILFSHTKEEWIRDEKTIKQKKQHQKPSGFCFEENLNFCKIAPSTVMMHQSIFEKVGYFDESLEVCEDYDLWLRVLKNYEVGLIDEVLTTKYAGHEQLSFKYHSMDKFRILSLLKHKNQADVKVEIEKKLEILLKGAVKHENHELVVFCEKVYRKLRNSF
jgi:glycosyltransferase involved in cell wall biosynthesis